MMRIFVYAIIFFAFFDLFTQLPIMSPFARSVGASPFLIGLIVGMYSLSNTVGNIASGIFTDRRGPFPVLVLGLFSTAFALFLYLLADSPVILIAVRFIHGLTAGLIVPAAFTFIANATTKDKKGKSSAISGAFVGSAAIIGPAFSGILSSRTSELHVLMTTGVITLILACLTLLFLRTSISQNKEKQAQTNPNLFENIPLFKAFIGAFFLMFSQGVIAYLLPLKAIELGGDTKTSGLLLSTFGLVALLIFVLPTNRIFDRLQPINMLLIGMILMGVSQVLLSQSTEISTLYYVMSLYGVGFAFLFPAINSQLIEATTVEVRGKAYGYFYAFFSFGAIAGSFVTGLISSTIDVGFIFTGCLLLVSALILRLVKAKRLTI